MGHSHRIRLILQILEISASPLFFIKEGSVGVELEEFAVEGFGADVGHKNAFGSWQQSRIKQSYLLGLADVAKVSQGYPSGRQLRNTRSLHAHYNIIIK